MLTVLSTTQEHSHKIDEKKIYTVNQSQVFDEVTLRVKTKNMIFD